METQIKNMNLNMTFKNIFPPLDLMSSGIPHLLCMLLPENFLKNIYR